MRQVTFLLRRPRRHNNNIALPCFGMLSGAHTSARVTMISGIAEVLYLGVAKFSLGIHEQDFAGDLVVLFHNKVARSVDGLVNKGRLMCQV